MTDLMRPSFCSAELVSRPILRAIGAKLLFHKILIFASSMYPILVHPVLRSLDCRIQQPDQILPHHRHPVARVLLVGLETGEQTGANTTHHVLFTPISLTHPPANFQILTAWPDVGLAVAQPIPRGILKPLPRCGMSHEIDCHQCCATIRTGGGRLAA
jgi:hypothetical protein